MTESDTDSPAAQATAPSQGYGGIAGILIGESQKFLHAVSSSGKRAGTKAISDDFLTEFLASADEFSTHCCHKLAALLKKSSEQSEVRDTPDSVLVRLVRSRAFEIADSNLVEFVLAAKSCGLGAKLNFGNLAKSRVREAGEMNETAEGGPKPSSTHNAKTDALVHAYDYISKLDGLAHDFLDYGGGKLLGGQADYNSMNAFVQTVQDSIQPDLADVLAYFESFDAVQKKKWNDLRAAENEAIRNVALQGSHSTSSKKGGFFSLLLGGLCCIPIWFVLTTGISHRWVLGTAAAIGLVGVIIFFRGLFKLTNA